MSDYQKRKEELQRSEVYISKIGASQPHLGNEVGKFITIRVTTQIHHQLSPGANNYHVCEKFDELLSIAVSNRIEELAADALRIGRKRVSDEIESRRAELKKELAELVGWNEKQDALIVLHKEQFDLILERLDKLEREMKAAKER